MSLLSKFLKQVRQWGLTYIHTCWSYVHTPCDITRTAHL